ncbi:MAG: adenylosuccinate lyase [Candidatus Pacebacteria bacterium]|nr:adenylosuccinate lyase [Candidatus Paceibacterota bacterium]MCF7863052.1 adenylosuccinate lyase [Candidatus Paceibacterota bacterium]
MKEEKISPIDGRYFENTKALIPYFSEKALMQYRVIVEGEYLIALSETKLNLRKFSEKEKALIRDLYNLSNTDVQIISDIEKRGYKNIKATDHDVKAVEYFLKLKLANTSIKDSLEWIHFALTSEDTNNLAYSLLLSDSLDKVIKPKLEEVKKQLDLLAQKHKSLPMLARTHGQPASPTTFGKEIKVFSVRLEKKLKKLSSIKIEAKLNGATGNWNAHFVAYPKINWQKWSRDFIESFNKNRTQKLSANLMTTQIECHDSYLEIFDTVKQINNILIDFNQDMWRYISDDWIGQKPKDGTIGSSTMPHKINPIKFENSEGNLGLANSLLEFFGRKLSISRLQRDLSDSTVERNFGTAFAHSLLAYEYLLKGLNTITINEEKVKTILIEHPEIVAEAIQTILRRDGFPFPYETLKTMTRGKKVSLEDFAQFIESLSIPTKTKKELLKITPLNYIGLANKML